MSLLLASVASATGSFTSPKLDWHALAPEVILTVTICLLITADVVLLERARPIIGALAGLGLLAAIVPLLTLATSDVESRSMFGGAYVVDSTSLLLKALFLVAGYVVILISTNYVAEGDYWESEYYTLMLCSILGMTVMASARDLISIFVALELLSIPAYMLAGWRKRDPKSNEAGMKYYLMGVFASAVLLYGMSLLYGWSGSTLLSEIGDSIAKKNSPAVTLGVLFVIVGFAFKVSAVPFHEWAPDTYEGAPTPVTAFLAVASKAAGFVAIIQVTTNAFSTSPSDLWKATTPAFFVLAALSMTIGNLIALKQTNVIRMLAYSGIAQAGFMLAPFVVLHRRNAADIVPAVVTYLVIYAAMNLGAFAVVIAAARKTRSAEISSFGGMFRYAPGLTVAMTIFLASLIGIPPLGGWYAKFSVLQVMVGSHSMWGYGMAVIMAVNSVIAAFYYLGIARAMWFDPAPDGDESPVRVPPSVWTAIAITVAATVLFGVVPGLVSDAAHHAPVIAIGR